MTGRIRILYGSYLKNRQGIRLADHLVSAFSRSGAEPDLIDAKALDLPMLDRMYMAHPAGTAPPQMEALAGKICAADAFTFVVGEYNWGVQSGLKNLTDHFLEEWYWRPAAIASYSAGRLAGAHAALHWHAILSETGIVVMSSSLSVGSIGEAFDEAGKPAARRGWISAGVPTLR